MKRSFISLVMVAVTLLVLVGCQASLDSRARGLLTKYQLHPQNGTVKVDAPAGITFDLVNNLSKQIGLDMSKYRLDNLDNIAYLLKEKAQGKDQRIYAIFVYTTNNKKIVGALLYLPGSTPSTQALNDRRHFVK